MGEAARLGGSQELVTASWGWEGVGSSSQQGEQSWRGDRWALRRRFPHPPQETTHCPARNLVLHAWITGLAREPKAGLASA